MMLLRQLILSLLICITTDARASFHSIAPMDQPWMDSVVAEGVKKIGEARTAQILNNSQPFQFPFSGEYYGSHYIVIDLAKWTPNLVSGVQYYERASSPAFISNSSSAWHTWDSINTYNVRNGQHPDYIPLYNIVLKNFPLALRKNVSTVNDDEGRNLFVQLQQLGAIDNEDYTYSIATFQTIISNIALQAQNEFGYGPVICYGSANLLGQYGNKPNMRASFGAYYIAQTGFNTPPVWMENLLSIPQMLCPPITLIDKPTIDEKNFQIATAIQHFIECNQYGVCIMDGSSFNNLYARWLYDNLKNSTVISKPLLLSTCMKVNGLSQEMAWAVLTAEFEQGHDQYVNTPLGPIYNAYTNNTLTTISTLCSDIVRAQVALKVQTNIGRDSALYYGRLVYRVPSYILSIDPYQRVNLLNAITNSSCSDINISNSISNYTNHCERIAKALYTHIPQSDLKTFLDQLKSSGLLWDLSYRLDNSTLGFFGNDNYTDFVFTISSYWKTAYPALASPSRTANVNYHVFKWESSYFNANAMISTNHSSNQIIAAQMARSGCPWTNLPLATITMDVYDPVTIHVAEGSIIPGLPGVKDLTVPAFFLDWLSHKKMLDDAATTAHVTLAVLALATGVGELYQATTMGMRVISALEVTISASDLVLLNENFRQGVISLFPTPQEGQDFLQVYERITMVINFSVTAKGLVDHLDNDFTYFSQKFDEQENGLKNVLGENSPEFRGMEKLRGEVAVAKASSDVIESLQPHIKAIHHRFEAAGTSFSIDNNSITYYTSSGTPFCKIENGDCIVLQTKPNISHYSNYLSTTSVTSHIHRFEQEGGAFIIRKSDIVASPFQTFPPSKFCGLRSDMDRLITNYNNSGQNVEVLATELDLGPNHFLPEDEIYYVKVDPAMGFHFGMPTGNEIGAYPGLWVPGGYTKHNTAEAVIINSENLVHNNSWATFVNLFGEQNITRIK